MTRDIINKSPKYEPAIKSNEMNASPNNCDRWSQREPNRERSMNYQHPDGNSYDTDWRIIAKIDLNLWIHLVRRSKCVESPDVSPLALPRNCPFIDPTFLAAFLVRCR